MFSESWIVVEAEVREYEPDVVVNVRKAGNRTYVTIEHIGINLANIRRHDNDGEQLLNQLFQPDEDTPYILLPY